MDKYWQHHKSVRLQVSAKFVIDSVKFSDSDCVLGSLACRRNPPKALNIYDAADDVGRPPVPSEEI